MKIAMTGSTGFLGKKLIAYLEARGHAVLPLTRSDLSANGESLSEKLAAADVVINLAGAPVVGRWSKRYKQQILHSRVDTTKRLCEAIVQLSPENQPGLLFSASAIGIYNNEKVHTEQSATFGSGFLTEVCQAWEGALEPLQNTQMRVVIGRIGVVLSSDGGALSKIIPLFKWGFGGKIASGQQGFSFIHIDDFCRAVDHILMNSASRGVYNLVSPELTTNLGFTNALASVLHRPALLPVPAFALKLLYGEGAAVLVEGQFAYPEKLLSEGFVFEYPHMYQTLASLLARN